MTDIRIDGNKAQRLIAQILRDEEKMLPEKANNVASNLCKRLLSAMGTPTKPGLSGYRLIPMFPPDSAEFAEEVGSKLADIDEYLARVLWEMVYERCPELPKDVVP
jgi:hypothetical protein